MSKEGLTHKHGIDCSCCGLTGNKCPRCDCNYIQSWRAFSQITGTLILHSWIDSAHEKYKGFDIGAWAFICEGSSTRFYVKCVDMLFKYDLCLEPRTCEVEIMYRPGYWLIVDEWPIIGSPASDSHLQNILMNDWSELPPRVSTLIPKLIGGRFVIHWTVYCRTYHHNQHIIIEKAGIYRHIHAYKSTSITTIHKWLKAPSGVFDKQMVFYMSVATKRMKNIMSRAKYAKCDCNLRRRYATNTALNAAFTTIFEV